MVRSSNAFNLWHWTGSAGLSQCPFAAGACLTYFTYSRHLPQNSPCWRMIREWGLPPFPPAGGVGGVLRSSPAHSSVWYGMGIMALKRFSFFFGRRSPSLQTVAVWSMVESRMVAPISISFEGRLNQKKGSLLLTRCLLLESCESTNGNCRTVVSSLKKNRR